MDVLGIGIGVSLEGVRHENINTMSPLDFAYWCTTYVVHGKPSDYSDKGLDIGSGSLISWASNQIGIIDMPTDYDDIKAYCASTLTTTKIALSKRGALLINDNDIAITLGLNDILLDVYGRHFITKLSSFDITKWAYGAFIPGLVY